VFHHKAKKPFDQDQAVTNGSEEDLVYPVIMVDGVWFPFLDDDGFPDQRLEAAQCSNPTCLSRYFELEHMGDGPHHDHQYRCERCGDVYPIMAVHEEDVPYKEPHLWDDPT
jgi:hypothetical protein